jgi:hypothetical protein
MSELPDEAAVPENLTTWPRPRVFKIAGCWVWACQHSAGAPNRVTTAVWADAWTAAMVMATTHFVTQHDNGDVHEEGSW